VIGDARTQTHEPQVKGGASLGEKGEKSQTKLAVGWNSNHNMAIEPPRANAK